LTVCAVGARADAAHELAERVAAAYGLEAFSHVEAIRYTFNVTLPNKTISRNWVWSVKENSVTAMQQGTLHAYKRNAPDAVAANKDLDGQFVNDQYWLLFPFHLIWDKEATLTLADGEQPLPIGPGTARKLTVSYPAEGGYTPGDAYDLYVDSQNHLVQWVYRKGNSPTPTRITTWAQPTTVGPLQLCLDHRTPDSPFHLWFSDVGVRLTGTSVWIESQAP